jgi:putative ABC transport system permease protein
MLRNYLHIAWRNIRRNKLFALISIGGVALGSTACLLVWLICSYEFSFDDMHPNGERIYRVTSHSYRAENDVRSPNIAPPAPAAFRKMLTGVDAVTDITPYDVKSAIRSSGKPAKEFDDGYIVITDPAYFQIFQRHWLAGSPASSMTAPFQVVLTESRARQYFGPAAPEQWIGRTVTYDDSIIVSVSGIVRDWKGNTDFPYTEFISFSTIYSSSLKMRFRPDAWGARRVPNIWCFLLLSKGTNAARIDTQFRQLAASDPDTWRKMDLRLEPLTDIHFNTTYTLGDNIRRKASRPALYGMMGIAVFILLIAAINFINLSTAQSFRRAKEIGVRKVLGSGKMAIIGQFLTETTLLVLAAVTVGLLLVRPALHWFGDYFPEGMPYRPFSLHVLGFSLLLIFIVSFCAGFYPAIVLSSYLPVNILKGAGAASDHRSSRWRKGLIVFQFSIALLFIMATLVIGKQIKYMLNSDPGFQSKAILITRPPQRDSVSRINFLKTEMSRIPGVGAVILQGIEPIGMLNTYEDTLVVKHKTIIRLPMLQDAVNEEFLPFYDIRLVAGRNLLHSDSLKEFLINETASSELGFSRPEQAPGKMVYWRGKAYPIAGVVADFHQQSYRKAILPLFLAHIPDWEKTFAIRVKPGNISATISQLRTTWKRVYPNLDFDYWFLDEEIGDIYSNEQKMEHLLQVATGTAIYISCLGLFGLALFVTRQRAKEIAIRKVLGAGLRQILALLTWDFLRPIALAFCVAIPLTTLLMHRWLQQFAYRTSINVFVLLRTAVIIVAAGLATIGVQTIRSALANPVDSLGQE